MKQISDKEEVLILRAEMNDMRKDINYLSSKLKEFHVFLENFTTGHNKQALDIDLILKKYGEGILDIAESEKQLTELMYTSETGKSTKVKQKELKKRMAPDQKQVNYIG